jgi:phosphomannomutase
LILLGEIMSAFKAYDIRGVYGEDLTEDLAYRVGYFLPELLNSDHVLIGRDARKSSPSLFEAMCKGVNDRGCDVWDIGVCSTPTVYYAAPHLKAKAAVMITASHNPPKYNGFKISREEAKPVGKDTGLQDLEQLCKKEIKVSDKKGKVIKHEIRAGYLDFVRQWLKPLKGMKIVFDSSNGVEGLYLEELFADSGADCQYINLEIDGSFPNHEPNPLEIENVEQLMAKVKETGADVGVIFDGDADRVVFVDENGEYVYPDIAMGVMAREMLKNEKTAVSCDVRTSRAVFEEIERLGGKPLFCKVGHVFAKALIREHDAVFGGELAGHYYFKSNSYCDSGLIACLVMLGILAESPKSMSELVAEVARYHCSGEINFKLENKDEVIKIVQDNFQGGKLNDLDGIRVDFEDWWYNMRKSNTEPYLRLVCEANSKDVLDAKVAEITAIVEKHKTL